MSDIKWIKVTDRLPIHGSRCLCYCFQGILADIRWKGIVDCTYSSNIGFRRCETSTRDIYVTHWAEFPQQPPENEVIEKAQVS